MRRNRHDDAIGHFPGADNPEFLPDEIMQDARIASADVRERVTRLETQTMAQYTAMAAYATIAQTHTENLRAEGRHDLDRSQATLIGLVERVRRECADSIEAVLRRTGDGAEGEGARLGMLEQRFEALADALERSIESQQLLAEQVTMLLEDKMHRDGWLVANGNAADLSMH